MQQPNTSNRLRPFRPTPFGRYTLLMPLSMGGMGEIFLARIDGPQGFEKLCVIKKILSHLAEDKDFVSRFVNEARTLVKLTHGSIAQVLDMGQFQGEPYLALEYIDGKDLRKVGARFRERGMPLPLTFVLFVMARVLDALAYAHRKRDDEDKEIGLVHRDMSPQNILISYEGEVKVIDFGLAKSTLNASKTNPSIILGKFLYMSPEQARHAKVDKRSDLYSVGLCLYELIAGKNPFEDVPPHALMAAVASPNIPHVQQVEPLCPTSVAGIIMRALAVDPAQRFQTAEELRGKLTGALMEIDASAGPESCSRFMRDMFASEYAAERKLLAQLKEAARQEQRPDAPPEPAPSPMRPAQVRPLTSARSGPRVDPPPAEDETTPGPTDLRKYGLEPTLPRALPVHAQALSFAPTPKVGGTDPELHEGERETVPGISIDQVRATATDDDRQTAPHLTAFTPPAASSEMAESDAPTRPVTLGPMVRAPQAAGPMGPEPVTSQMQVVQASDQDLPSVMVAPTVGAPTPPPAPAPGRHAPARPGPRPVVPSVLVPASSVRAPEVVAPLPKALEGRHRPDESNTIDRDTRTRTRRSGWWLMLLPLLAILALVAVVGATILRERSAEEADDAARNDSLLRSDSEDRQRKPLDNTLLPDEPAPLPQPNPDEPAADDDLGGLPVKDGAAPPGAAAPAGSKVHKPAPPRKRN